MKANQIDEVINVLSSLKEELKRKEQEPKAPKGFIILHLTNEKDNKPVIINVTQIVSFRDYDDYTYLIMTSGFIDVVETPTEIIELINKDRYEEDTKN